MQQIQDIMIKAALEAGTKILEIYKTPFKNIPKADGSPVTIADKKSEEIIISHLAKTNIPILAEESAAAGIIPNLGNRFFCVDPLDGTKEFIKKNGEFTINIALIENARPILGLISVPAKGKAYIGSERGAFKFDINKDRAEELKPISVAGCGEIKLVASRSHGSSLLKKLEQLLPSCKDISVGSALKFCMLAEGKARLYPRFTPVYEWDSAAGQAIVEAAGGVVLTLDGKPLSYNKSDKNYQNPFFVAADCQQLGKQVAKYMSDIVT